jgi:uncharacterized protein (TIGR03083 family)
MAGLLLSSLQSMTDREELAGYVAIWWQAINDFVALLEEVPEAEWSTPTDLAGWDVKACAAHTAHLEGILAGNPEESAEIGEPAHVTGLMGMYTEIGVVNRRDASADAIINEIHEVTTKRHTALLADPPTDGSAKPAVIFGGVPWTWRTLLRNRPLDVWMHEQDVRRAVGRPGNLDGAPARHAADYLAEGLGFVLGKKVGAPTGTSLLLDLAGSEPFAFEIDENGRGQRVDPPADPTVTLSMDRESYIRLAGGRCAAEPGRVTVLGDEELGAQVLANLATTP